MRGRVGINKTGEGGRVRSVFAAFLLLCAVLCGGCGQAQPAPGPSEPTRAPVTETPARADAVQATATSEPESPSQPAAEETPSAALTTVPPASPAQAETVSPPLPPLPPASPSPVGPETAADDPPAAGSFVRYTGPDILEQRILHADIIARARLHSVGLADVTHDDKGMKCPLPGWRPPRPEEVEAARTGAKGYYTEGIAYTFDIIEYLKGSGDDQLSVLDYYWSRKRPECRERFGTEQEAIAAAAPELEEGRRDTSIEGREAIIFLVANQHPEDSAYAYELMHADSYNDSYDPYVPSQPAWMPAAEVTSGEPVHGEAAGGLIFRSVTPDARATETAAPSTLAELRTLVAEVVEDYEGGSSEHGESAYKHCLTWKYELEKRARRGQFLGDIHFSSNSGAPVGTRIVGTERWGSLPKEYMSGADAHLFSNQPAPFFATRPTPLGDYRFFHTGFETNWLVICGGPTELPESLRESREIVVHLTAPEGTLHEAFFDPVASGEAVGAGGADGVLKPAAFTVNGSQTTIRRIEWGSGRVVMRLEPDDNALAGHHVDFIPLDGSVALRLDFDAAAQVTNGGAPALAWGVCNQPWSDGDLLMLRIRESEANLTGATRDADCPATATTTPSSD